MERPGSSESDSGAAADGAEVGGAACALCGSRDGAAAVPLLSCAAGACGAGARVGVTLGSGFGGSGVGVSSMVECFPVVQGGIERNSSKVRTRGLQHFQPVMPSVLVAIESECMRGHADTFLAFVEDGRARMIDAVFFRVGEYLAAALVDTFLGHCCKCFLVGMLSWVRGREKREILLGIKGDARSFCGVGAHDSGEEWQKPCGARLLLVVRFIC